MKRTLVALAAALSALLAAAGLWQWQPNVAQADHGDRPNFAVDPFWPKPLPNRWLLGQVAGIAVDRHDNIWIVQRPRTLTNDEAGSEEVWPYGTPPRVGRRSDCCNAAPSIMKFNRAGDLLDAWGGPEDPGFLETRCTVAMGCEWPTNEHGIYVDHNDFVYMAGNGGGNHQVLKFTKNGDFVLQIGKAGLTGGSNATTGGLNGTPLLGQPADMEVDPDTNELYIADGYQNKRVLVVDARTGLYRRHWGAYGNPPNDAPAEPYNPAVLDPDFRNPVHCVRIAEDGLVYVCDRVNNRYQIFTKSGRFVEEVLYERDTLGNGAVWDIDLSPDRRQRYLYNADGENNVLSIHNRRSGDLLNKVGRNGRYAGQFHWVHNLAVDSKGNIYTAEVDTGKRAQKFVPRGNEGKDRDD